MRTGSSAHAHKQLILLGFLKVVAHAETDIAWDFDSPGDGFCLPWDTHLSPRVCGDRDARPSVYAYKRLILLGFRLGPAHGRETPPASCEFQPQYHSPDQ
jgi:hypothetical protein